MKRRMRRLTVCLLCLLWFPLPILAESGTEAIDRVIKDMDPKEYMVLGPRLSDKDTSLFSNSLTVRAFERRVFFATEQSGTNVVESVSLMEKNPKQDPHGDIAAVYSLGGKKTYGSPGQGEHSIFKRLYVIHIFTKSVIVWHSGGGGTEFVLLEKPFKWPKGT